MTLKFCFKIDNFETKCFVHYLSSVDRHDRRRFELARIVVVAAAVGLLLEGVVVAAVGVVDGIRERVDRERLNQNCNKWKRLILLRFRG